MKPNEARELIGMIKAATTQATLDDEKITFWEASLSPLDADAATKAVLVGKRLWRYFPSWAEFEEVYKVELRRQQERKLAEQVGEQRAETPETHGYYQPPEWVLVWSWCRFQRSPRNFRSFPQQRGHVDDADIMSLEKYEELRQEWIAAGSPKAEHPIPMAQERKQ